jgi:regulator of cell morphogenesis and NO signaling
MDTMKHVGDWVAEDFSRAAIFESLGIDFCCGGKRPLKDACDARGIDVDFVIRILNNWDQKGDGIDYTTLSPADLCNHIEKTHHAYLKEKLPFIHKLLEKVVAAHGEEYAPLLKRFDAFAAELSNHMEKEERVVFPKIRSHADAASACRVLEKEHDEAKEALEFFRKFTDGYKIPKAACITHRTVILELESLEKDMHLHVYKENHLLFPKK